MGAETKSRSQSKEASGNSQWPPWVAAIAAFLTLVVTVVTNYYDHQAARRDRLLEHRREALFAALRVIDHVYSNEPTSVLDKGRPPNPHEWDIQLARDADNQMRVYCEYPETFESFRRALGLYNPPLEQPKGISPEALAQFREQVARELDLPKPIGGDPNLTWISSLAGAK